MAERDREKVLAFVRAVEPVRGKRFLAVRKTRNPLARAIGYKIKKFYSELKCDTGYCLLWAFKDAESSKPIEEYRFVGSAITADIMIDWSEELAIDDPQYRACLILKGSDLKREDGRALTGELFLFASDSGVVLQIKKAALAMANAARAPDGSCIYGRVVEEGLLLRLGEPQGFKMSREQALQITRACARLAALPRVIPNLFSLEAAQADPKAAIELLNTPQTDVDDTAEAIRLLARGLVESLRTLSSRPVPSRVFATFSTQAEKCRILFENQNGDVAVNLFAESEEFTLIMINFLRDLGSADAITVIREVTRAVKHIAVSLRGSVSLMECVDCLGPLLIEDFKKSNVRELSWLFASACSKQRDRIFNRARGAQPSPSPVGRTPVSILRQSARAGALTGPASGNRNHSPHVQLLERASSHDDKSPRSTTHETSEPDTVSAAPAFSPQTPADQSSQTPADQSSQTATQDDGKAAIEEISSSPKGPVSAPNAVEEVKFHEEASSPSKTPARARPVSQNDEAVEASPTVHPDDYINIQAEIDSLTRLHEYLRMRLRDEPNHPNASLWRSEMAECEAEITSLSPTMFFVSSSRAHDVEIPDPRSNHASNAAATEVLEKQTENSTADVAANGQTQESIDFVERALSLWAESRKETLVGDPEQVADSLIVLKSTLQDVRALAENVDEFPGVAKAQKPLRETALALVGMLEENVSLRVKILSNDEGNSSKGRPSAGSVLPRKPETPHRAFGWTSAPSDDGVAVDEEEYEI